MKIALLNDYIMLSHLTPYVIYHKIRPPRSPHQDPRLPNYRPKKYEKARKVGPRVVRN